MALVHCRECGEMIAESAPTCPKCGAKQKVGLNLSTETEIDKDPNTGLNVVSFLWPIIGLILYIAYSETSPRRAKACGKWAIIGTVVAIAIVLIICLAAGVFVSSAVSGF